MESQGYSAAEVCDRKVAELEALLDSPELIFEDASFGVKVFCGDCLPFLKTLPANSIDAAIVDPPYGISVISRTYQNKDTKPGKALAHKTQYDKADEWDDEIPPPEYFAEIQRVSKEQVIFGGNYFAHLLPPSSSWIVWDKDNGANDFADCELAWTSHARAVRKIRYRWNGMLQEPGEPHEERIHPTQKPAKLLQIIIEKYTEKGSLVLDTHGGSGSTAIGCMRAGRRCWVIEKNPKYAAAIVERIKREIRREVLFEAAAVPQQQASLFAE